VVLQDADSIDLGTSSIFGILSVTAGNNITDSGNISVTGTTTFSVPNSGSITVDSAGNSLNGALILPAAFANLTLTDTTPLDLPGLNLSGSLNVTSSGAVSLINNVVANAGFRSAGTDFNNSLGTITTATGPVTIAHSGAVTLGTINAGANTVNLSGLTIDRGDFTGSNAVINGGTIGMTDPLLPVANVPTLRATLSQEVGGISGQITPGASLTTAPPATNISSPGTFIITGLFTYLASGQRLAEGAIAAIASETAFLDELEELLSKAAEADFFMEPPLLVTIETEQIGQLEYIPPEQIRKKDAEVPVDVNEQIRKEDLEKKKEKKPGPTSFLDPDFGWDYKFRLRPLRPSLLFDKNAAYTIPGLSLFIQVDDSGLDRPQG